MALAIETSTIYGRRLLEGISAYIREKSDWRILVEQRSLHDRPPDWLISWKGDGLISRATTQRIADELVRSGLPSIDVSDRVVVDGLPKVRSHDLAIGKLGATHFLERGLREFAFCGYERENWSRMRWEGFEAELSTQGFRPGLFESTWADIAAALKTAEESRIIAWLLSLPKPVGILCCNDFRTQEVLNACAIAGFKVPEEIALLGVDDDVLLCGLCRPTLSSIVPNAFWIGYRAAQMLDQWMAGVAPRLQVELVDPLGLQLRQSSDLLSIDDPIVLQAVKLIREKACDGLTVDQLSTRLNIHRSALERRFRKWFQHSPQQEIRQTQLGRVCNLLRETDLPITRIAQLVSITSPEYLNVLFKKQYKETPGEYRHKSRAGTHQH